MMTREDRDAWVTALRSGEYKQGQRALCSLVSGGYRYCCLGVLADVAWDGEWDRVGQYYALNGYSGSLPYEIEDALGLSSGLQGQLIDLNDIDRKTFRQIADWIEKNVSVK